MGGSGRASGQRREFFGQKVKNHAYASGETASTLVVWGLLRGISCTSPKAGCPHSDAVFVVKDVAEHVTFLYKQQHIRKELHSDTMILVYDLLAIFLCSRNRLSLL